MNFIRFFIAAAVLASSGWIAARQPISVNPRETVLSLQTEVDPSELPEIPALEPADALETIHVRDGFRVELVAAEPDVADPIQLAFDEYGRLFVVEMRWYQSESRADLAFDERIGRIRMLEDTTGDGRFDKSVLFADNLRWPSAVICYGGGVFVGNEPDILFLKDTTGDGRADVREAVITGFGRHVDRRNPQTFLNSFNWTLGNRIHGNKGHGGVIFATNDPLNPLDLRGRDFSFDPKTFSLRAESPGGHNGVALDDGGRKFICRNTSPFEMILYEDRYADRNPFHTMPRARLDITLEKGVPLERLRRLYRLSPEEPWRVLRNRWRGEGIFVGQPQESGFSTASSGITVYRGNAWPENFRNSIFVADSPNNVIHRQQLAPDGILFKARRPTDEQDHEFVASNDLWFRPVAFANAPDGTLYFADMYREVIDLALGIPEAARRHMDLNRGNDRGRIYRIVPEGFRQPAPPRLADDSTAQLVATLEHPNGWHRDTAARLIYEREDKSAVPLLERLLRQSKNPPGRMHALYALRGLDALRVEHVLSALDDADALVREHSVRLAEDFGCGSAKLHLCESAGLVRAEPEILAPLREKLFTMTGDPAPRVRYQLAFTLGEFSVQERIEPLARLARSDGGSRWMQAAILSSLAEGAGEMFAKLADDETFRSSATGLALLRQLGSIIGARNRADDIAKVTEFVRANEWRAGLPLVIATGQSLHAGGGSLADAGADESLKDFLDFSLRVAQNARNADSTRAQAIQTLGLARWAAAKQPLIGLLDPRESTAVQRAAVTALSLFGSDFAETLISKWHVLTPRVRSDALNLLLARPERALTLLQGIENEIVQRVELASTQIALLRHHHDPAVREEAARLFGESPTELDQVIEEFRPALQLNGDPARGRTIFVERCASCHRFGNEGHALGPDLTTMRTSGAETLLEHILDPSREIAPEYVSYLVETKDGDVFVGIMGSESAAGIVLRQAFGMETTVQRPNIARIQPRNESIMPEGLEAGLSQQDMADLIEFMLAGATD